MINRFISRFAPFISSFRVQEFHLLISYRFFTELWVSRFLGHQKRRITTNNTKTTINGEKATNSGLFLSQVDLLITSSNSRCLMFLNLNFKNIQIQINKKKANTLPAPIPSQSSIGLKSISNPNIREIKTMITIMPSIINSAAKKIAFATASL